MYEAVASGRTRFKAVEYGRKRHEAEKVLISLQRKTAVVLYTVIYEILVDYINYYVSFKVCRTIWDFINCLGEANSQ